MSLVQVLERPTRGGKNDILFEELPSSADFRELEKNGRIAALWGAKQLLELASKFNNQQFTAYDCTFVDHTMTEMADDAYADAKDIILQHINSGNSNEAIRYLTSALPGVLVWSVALRGHGANAYRIRLSQNGAVEVPTGRNSHSALQLLRSVLERD